MAFKFNLSAFLVEVFWSDQPSGDCSVDSRREEVAKTVVARPFPGLSPIGSFLHMPPGGGKGE